MVETEARLWYNVAKILVDRDPDATFWDLFKTMYELKTGSKVPDFPDEDEVISLHMEGKSSKTIGEMFDEPSANISAILESVGFRPWKNDLPHDVHTIHSAVKEHGVYKAAKNLGITAYIANRAFEEGEKWAATR